MGEGKSLNKRYLNCVGEKWLRKKNTNYWSWWFASLKFRQETYNNNKNSKSESNTIYEFFGFVFVGICPKHITRSSISILRGVYA